MKTILVVDDEKKIVDIIQAYLEKDGYRVIAAYDGASALKEYHSQKPDLLILDLMLPETSGWDVCRAVRKESEVPIIMLTARDEVTDKIIGLEMGADDYVTKPFDPKELVSRVKAILRRMEKQPGGKVIALRELKIEVEKRRVTLGERILELTPIEFDLLLVMAENPGRVFSRMQLLDRIQGDAYEGYERTIDSHIKNLRKKIEADPDHPSLITTVYGVGYKLEEK